MKFQITSKSEKETREIAKTISSFFSSGDLILLEGDLGAGKTHFVKGFAQGIGSDNTVTSPTFGIANFYNAPNKELLHIDLYRLNSVDEFNDLGMSDYFPQTITMIEWGTKFLDCFDDYFMVAIEYKGKDKNSRQITFTCQGDKYNSILNLLSQKLPTLLSC